MTKKVKYFAKDVEVSTFVPLFCMK